MCGRFALDKDTDELIATFVAEHGLAALKDWRPSWNIKPTQQIPVLLESAKGKEEVRRRLDLGRWSLVPPWAKELRLKFPTFNARAENITTKPTWKSPVKSKRAIIPASGYYEWQKNPDGSKTPHYIHMPDHQTLGFAGLYSWWPDPAVPDDDERRWHLTATILTSDAVDQLVGIHDRNPVPLPHDFWDTWLDPEIEGDQSLVDAAVQAALPVAETLEAYPVRPLRGDGPELIERA